MNDIFNINISLILINLKKILYLYHVNNTHMINDSTTFYWKIGYNAYGGETERELKFLPNLK